MEIKKPDSDNSSQKEEATQLPLTPESANPPPEPQQKNPAAGKYNVIPDEILPPEDKPLLSREEARRKRREDYLRNGS